MSGCGWLVAPCPRPTVALHVACLPVAATALPEGEGRAGVRPGAGAVLAAGCCPLPFSRPTMPGEARTPHPSLPAPLSPAFLFLPCSCAGPTGNAASNAIVRNLKADRRESAVISTAETAVAHKPTPGTSVAKPESFTTETRAPIKNTGTIHQGLIRSNKSSERSKYIGSRPLANQHRTHASTPRWSAGSTNPAASVSSATSG